jgi:hypothetical protein
MFLTPKPDLLPVKAVSLPSQAGSTTANPFALVAIEPHDNERQMKRETPRMLSLSRGGGEAHLVADLAPSLPLPLRWVLEPPPAPPREGGLP